GLHLRRHDLRGRAAYPLARHAARLERIQYLGSATHVSRWLERHLRAARCQRQRSVAAVLGQYRHHRPAAGAIKKAQRRPGFQGQTGFSSTCFFLPTESLMTPSGSTSASPSVALSSSTATSLM